MKITLLVVACVLALAVCGCAWIEAQLTPAAELQRIGEERAILDAYKVSVAQYEAAREYWRNLIAQLPMDDARRVEWLAKEDQAFKGAAYYRALIVEREPALLAHEARVQAAEGPGDVIRSAIQFGKDITPAPYRPIAELIGGVLLLAWGVYERTKKKQVTSAAQAVITSVQPLVDRASPEEVERIAEIQGLAGARLVDAAQGKRV